MSVLSDFEEQVGLHRTHAAAEAVRRSDRSRIDVRPLADGSGAVFVSQPRFIKDAHMFSDPLVMQVPAQLIGVPYGFDEINVTHTGSTMIFENKSQQYEFALPFEDEPYTIVSYIVEKEPQPRLQLTSLESGDQAFLYGNVRIVNNINADYVEVCNISDPGQGPRIVRLNRDDDITVMGMTYADARRQLVDPRIEIYDETFDEARENLQRQTNLQIPTRFRRNNAGKIYPREGDVDERGAYPSDPFAFGHRLIHLKVNRINLPDFSDEDKPIPEAVYARNKGYVTSFDDLEDNYGFKLGPIEISTCERLYRRFLYNDENLLPETEQDIIRSVIEKQVIALNDDPEVLQSYRDTLLAVKQIAVDQRLEFPEALNQLAIRRMRAADSTDFATFRSEIVELLSRGMLTGVKARMEFTVAYGCLVTYGRYGMGQRFINLVNGGRGTPDNNELSIPLNRIAVGTSSTATFDPTTGYGLASSEQLALPPGLQPLSRTPLTLLGYFKEFGENDPTYMSKPCVINFVWEVDLSQFILEQTDIDQAAILDNFQLVTQYLDNLSSVIKVNTNIYSQFMLARAWDNIALPLTKTVEERSDNEAALIVYDRVEQFVKPGIETGDGAKLRALRFVANGDRITYGVPTVDQVFDLENLEAKTGYRSVLVTNTEEPFVIIEEQNTIAVPRAEQQPRPPSIDAGFQITKTATDGEVTLLRDHSGYFVQEADTMTLNESPLDRTQTRISPTPFFPPRVSYSDMVEITSQTFGYILSQLATLGEVPAYTMFGTVLEDNETTVLVQPDDRPDLQVPAENLDAGNIGVGDRVLVVEKSSKKYAALKLPITTTIANVTTREIVADRFSPQSVPTPYAQISASDVNTSLLQMMLETMNTVNSVIIEPTAYQPEYASTVQSTTETNNTVNNTVTVSAISANGENLYRFTTASGSAQDISLVIQHPIPFGFDGFDLSANPIDLRYSVSNGAGTNLVQVEVLDSTGTQDVNVTLPQNTTLQDEQVGPLTGTYTPGGFMRIVITVTVISGETVDVGTLRVRNK